jgi:class 3 adenylate cyclase
MRAITIDGKEQRYDGLTDDRRGIKSGGHMFLMFPAARSGGLPIDPMPPIGPREIRRVTTEYPDLTAEYPETVKTFYQKRQGYHRGVTYEQWCKEWPQSAWISAEEFERGRQKIVSQTLEEFAKTNRAKERVWNEHGTQEIGDRIGLLDDYERIILVQWLKNAGTSEAQAWRDLHRVKWVASYDDPAKTRIYLFDLIEEPDPKAAELEFKKRNLETVAKFSNDKRHIGDFVGWAGVNRVTLAIVFTDIVGSVAMGEKIKDARMSKVRRAHFVQGRKLIAQHKGYEIKTNGDSFMVAFWSVEKAFDFARALQSKPGYLKIKVRAGIHIGPMDLEEEDLFGNTISFAARVIGVNKKAEIWLSDRAKEDIDRLGAEHHQGLKWKRHGGLALKGFRGKFKLWSLAKQ